MIFFPTHFSKHSKSLLDLFFIDDLTKRLLYDQVFCPTFSRHDLIFLAYDFQFTHLATISDYNIDYVASSNAIDNVEWPNMYHLNIDLEGPTDYCGLRTTALFHDILILP